jgi:RNA polymerase sigma factor (sigma-70 family)
VRLVTLEELARLAVAGDGAALSTLCEELEVVVHRLCLRMLGDPTDAEDAAQDVLVKVITNLSRFEGRSALTTWVHQIAVRHVLSLKQSRAEIRAVDEVGFAALLEKGAQYAASRPPPSPEDRALINEVRLSCTQGMLLILGREERLALVLVDLLGLDSAEAAVVVETSHDAFRQRLSRARTRLGSFLKAKCGVANDQASCRCETQIAAKKALGGGKERFMALSIGDLESSRDLQVAHAELVHVRVIGSAFCRDGLLGAPSALRTRMQHVLPTLLG